MPILRSLKPPKPIPYVEIDTSSLNATLKSRKKLMDILQRNVEVYRENEGETALHFNWNKKRVEVGNMFLVIYLNAYELLLIEPSDPPRGTLEVDLSHPFLKSRNDMENMIGGY